jgi:hypothetical protein
MPPPKTPAKPAAQAGQLNVPSTAAAAEAASPGQDTPQQPNLLAFLHPCTAAAMGTSEPADILAAWKALEVWIVRAQTEHGDPYASLRESGFSSDGSDARHCLFR